MHFHLAPKNNNALRRLGQRVCKGREANLELTNFIVHEEAVEDRKKSYLKEDPWLQAGQMFCEVGLRVKVIANRDPSGGKYRLWKSRMQPSTSHVRNSIMYRSYSYRRQSF